MAKDDDAAYNRTVRWNLIAIGLLILLAAVFLGWDVYNEVKQW